MIFYFSGTGNSLWVAKKISESSGEKMISIADCMNDKNVSEHTLQEGESIGFVYPVYAWAPPKMVLRFIEGLHIANSVGHFTYSVATCGDTAGNTMKVLAKSLERAGMQLDSAFSVQMPNNYILSFDVDSKELEKEKLSAAEQTMQKINAVILDRKKGEFELVKGFAPGIMTAIANPLFNRFALRTDKFYSTANCTTCGICERICPCRNIRVDEKPRWGKECTQCLACLNCCPVKAVQYGSGTLKKGRYVNPNVSIPEMFRK